MICILDLFSGIGGISLGLERTGGFKTVAFCEIEPFPRLVLAKHWPEVPIHDDVRTISGESFRGRADMVAGGFPCQDISVAGKGVGIEKGERSGLWREMFRIIDELRPRWVLAENVPALRTRGADRVLGDLEGIGYSCWPLVVGARHVGAPHRRDRVWIVAHRDGGGCEFERITESSGLERAPRNVADGCGELGNTLRRDKWRVGEKRAETGIALDRSGCELRELADAARDGQRIEPSQERADRERTRTEGDGVLADAGSAGREERHAPALAARAGHGAGSDAQGVADAQHDDGRSDEQERRSQGRTSAGRVGQGTRWPSRPGQPQHEWEAPRLLERGLGAATDGLPGKLVRRRNRMTLKAAGNSVVPQVVEMIGRAILEAESEVYA